MPGPTLRNPEAKARHERELAMYGCTAFDLRESIEDSVYFKLPNGVTLWAMSVMSDAQEEMARGMYERARQSINFAKYALNEYVIQKTIAA